MITVQVDDFFWRTKQGLAHGKGVRIENIQIKATQDSWPR